MVPASLEAAFRDRYRAEFGYDLPGSEVELASIGVSAWLPEGPRRSVGGSTGRGVEERSHTGIDRDGRSYVLPVLARNSIGEG